MNVPIFRMILVNLSAANLLSPSDRAPVMTSLPLPKMSAVVFGSRIRMMTARESENDFKIAKTRLSKLK
jgi:hypothetical protein